VPDQAFWRLRPNAPAAGTYLGALDDISIGAAREFRFGRGRSAFSMFVVRLPDGDVRGYLNICPHFSLPLNHQPDSFLDNGYIRCAQHFAHFRMEDGTCVSGACEGSRLDAIAISRDMSGSISVI
jgi:nitrite reductase/ring-hydroxylating ferredoxin subunit